MSQSLDPTAIAHEVYERVMRPLVIGGPLRPGRAFGPRAAWALARLREWPDAPMDEAVSTGRIRRARALVPIDSLGPPSGAEAALAAALHDVVQAANPSFSSPLRRGSAGRLLDLAQAAVVRVGPPKTLRDALSRHSWFARLLDITRVDTSVAWWAGSQTFLGTEPPHRLSAWPGIRRVRVTRTHRALLDLAPLAFAAGRLAEVVVDLLRATPLTDLATCTRVAPAFQWDGAVASLAATHGGRVLVLRALAAQPCADVDAVLGRTARDVIRSRRELAVPLLAVLAARAIAVAEGHLTPPRAGSVATDRDGIVARSIGAASVMRDLLQASGPRAAPERRRLLTALEASAREGEVVLGSLIQ